MDFKTSNMETNQAIYEAITADKELTVAQTLQNNNFALSNFQEYIEYNIYSTPNLTLKDTLGDYLEEIMQEYKFLSYNTPEEIIPISMYNKIAKLYNNETYDLNENEYMIIADFKSVADIRNITLKMATKLQLMVLAILQNILNVKMVSSIFLLIT